MSEDKNKVKTIVSAKSDITDNVTFGRGCIVHPSCTIIAEGGEIIFGDYNIIEERVTIINKKNKDPSKNKTMNIGSFNLFEVGTKIDSSDIGNMNQFEPRSIIDQGCIIKDNCTIGATVKVPSNTVIGDKKIYFPDKVVEELNFDGERFKKQIISMQQTLAKLIPANNPVKEL